jgi:hypothetical protein
MKKKEINKMEYKKNIFYTHYLKRQGKIFKDLAYLGHNQRIDMLEDFKKFKSDFIDWAKKDNNRSLEDKQKMIASGLRSIRFYDKLISYIRKNPDIAVRR